MKNLITTLILCSFCALGISQPSTGKIWLDGELLFVNAPERGVQVMNNTNTRRPESVGFVAIPGNIDMAVIDHVMYANHFDDLVAFDWQKYIENNELVEMARFEGLFPQHRPRAEAMNIGDVFIGTTTASSRGGSMACFAFDNASEPKYMYAANEQSIYTFNVEDSEQPIQIDSTLCNGEKIETIFIEDGLLFIGTPSGMLVYSLEDPENPNFIGEYEHVTGCDPVVASEGRAFVTVRSGATCNNVMPVNQLHVVNIGSFNLEGSFQLNNPHGVGVDQNLAFVCDGNDGIKVLDVSSPGNIRLMSRTQTEGTAYDLIVRPGRRELIAVSGDNVYQYRYTATGNLTKLGAFQLDFNR